MKRKVMQTISKRSKPKINSNTCVVSSTALSSVLSPENLSGSSSLRNSKVPPPEERLCKKHGRPITPSSWAHGCRTTECSKCITERRQSPEARERRKKKWYSELIICANHPDRRCQLSAYARSGLRRCSSCENRRADNSRSNGYKRGLNKRNYNASVRSRRSGVTSRSLTALQLFVRNTGMNILGAF
jgi:hypothetical protein